MARTMLGELGWNPAALGCQLSRKESGVSGVCNKAQYLPESRKIMQEWADYLDTLRLSPNLTKQAALTWVPAAVRHCQVLSSAVPTSLRQMPKTFFIHEQQPSIAQLLEQGMRLWHEEVELRPGRNLERLWPMACELLDKELRGQRHVDFLRYIEENKITLPEGREFLDPSEMISANTLRWLIVGGMTVPAWWDSPEPYPYQGLFISAFYFLEAKNKLEEANAKAAWVSLTQAYYYLGMNSATLTAHESASDAAKSRHAKNSKGVREIIVTILAAMRGDTSIKSGAIAMARVVAEIEGNPDHMNVLNDFDKKSSEKTKTSKSKLPKSPLARLYDRIEEWSAPDSPYPDIFEALAPFKRGRRSAVTKKECADFCETRISVTALEVAPQTGS